MLNSRDTRNTKNTKRITEIVWDVDSQNDFINPKGSLVVPGAYEMKQNFADALQYFKAKGTPILGSVDAHTGPELIPGTEDQYFPLHCIKGTWGQLKIPETLQGVGLYDILFVSDNKYTPAALDMIADEAKNGKRLYFEKQGIALAENPNAAELFARLGVKKAYLMGVATNICVEAADAYFRDLGIQTYIVESAVKGMQLENGDTGKKSIERMLNGGTKIYRI